MIENVIRDLDIPITAVIGMTKETHKPNLQLVFN